MINTIPKELSDFKVWLHPRNLKNFKKLEVIQLASRAYKTPFSVYNESTLQALSTGLQNTDHDQGQFALRLYFYQLHLDQKIGIDLRRKNIIFQDHWRFESSKINHHFDQRFQQALCQTYKIFFKAGDGELKEQLFKMGLLTDDVSAPHQEELVRLFEGHFGEGADAPIEFKFSKLLNSFSNIFDFMGKAGVKVPSEFALIGFYLSSLYWNLEETHQAYDIREAFEHAASVAQTQHDSALKCT